MDDIGAGNVVRFPRPVRKAPAVLVVRRSFTWISGWRTGGESKSRYYENGYPKLPACLDRRPKPALAEAA